MSLLESVFSELDEVLFFTDMSFQVCFPNMFLQVFNSWAEVLALGTMKNNNVK